MKPGKIRSLGALLLLAAILAAIAVSRRKPEVLYQNRPVSYWTAQLGNMDPTVRNDAVAALKAMGQNAIPALDRDVRRAPWSFEMGIGLVARELPRGLVNNVNRLFRRDEKKLNRLNAIHGLEMLGPDAVPAIPALESALIDGDMAVSTAAAIALSRLGSHAVPTLIRAFHDRNPNVRANACYALGLIGPPAKEAIPDLWKICAQDIGAPGLQACDSLGRIREPAVPFLAKQLDAPDDRLRGLAAYALGMMGPYAEEAIPALVRHVKATNATTRKRIVSALADIQPTNPAAGDALLRSLNDVDSGIRLDALRGLGTAPRVVRTGTPLIVRTLGDIDPAVRGEAAFILGQLGARGASFIPDLQKLLDDSNEQVRQKAEQALKTIELSSNK